MVAVPSPLLFVPEAPKGPSPLVPLLLLGFVILYVFYRGNAVAWVRSIRRRVPEGDEDRSDETE